MRKLAMTAVGQNSPSPPWPLTASIRELTPLTQPKRALNCSVLQALKPNQTMHIASNTIAWGSARVAGTQESTSPPLIAAELRACDE